MKKITILILLVLAVLPVGSVFAQESNSEIRNLVVNFIIEGDEEHVDYITARIESIIEVVGATEYSIEGNTMTIQASQWITQRAGIGCGGGSYQSQGQMIFESEVHPCIGFEESAVGGESIYTTASYRDGIFNIVVIPPTDNPTSNMLEWTEVALTTLPIEMQEVVELGCKDEAQVYQNLTRTFVVCTFHMYGGEILPLGGIIADDNVNGVTVYQPYDNIVDAEGNYLYTQYENAVSDDWSFYFGAPSLEDDVESALAVLVDDLPDMTEVLFEMNSVQLAVAELLAVDNVDYQPALNVFFNGEYSWFPMSVMTEGNPWAGTISAFNAFGDEHRDSCVYTGGRENAGTYCEGLPLQDYDWVNTFPMPQCETGNAVLIQVGDFQYPFCDNWYSYDYPLTDFPQNQ